jgi:hypothetical protein
LPTGGESLRSHPSLDRRFSKIEGLVAVKGVSINMGRFGGIDRLF